MTTIAFVFLVGVVSALVFWALDATKQSATSDAVSPPPSYERSSNTPTAGLQKTAVFIGDSYTTGSRASRPETKWTSLVSTKMGWRELNEGRGGTGYITTSDRRGCGRDYCPTYKEVIDQFTGSAPDIVVISGGRNDAEQPPPAYREKVASTISDALNKWPQAEVIVSSPIWDNNVPSWAAGNISAVREAAEDRGVTFVDLGQPLLGHSDYVSRDGIHPNDAGYHAIADAFLEGLGDHVKTDTNDSRSRTLSIAVATFSGVMIFVLLLWRFVYKPFRTSHRRR